MRRISSGALGVLLGVSLAACGGGKKSSTTMTIRLIATTTSNKVLVDRAPRGVVSEGDVLWAKATLRNAVPQLGRKKGAAVGSEIATNTVVGHDAGDVKVTATLPGGTIRAAGRVTAGSLETIPVTGGTGEYAGAQGTGSTRPRYPKEGSLRVFRLRLP